MCYVPVRSVCLSVIATRLRTILIALSATTAFAAPPETRPTTQPDLTGRLTQRGPLRVLEVWGDAASAGYAHGYLLGEEIVRLFDAYVFDERVGVRPAVYEAEFRSAGLAAFAFEERFERELSGMLAGLRARLGPDVRCKSLERPLDLDDLKIANVLSDLRGRGCTTFAAWGAATADGALLTARNLDYPATPEMVAHQIVLVHRARENARPWVGVTWPGLIGCYTAMNSAGVTVSVHDVPGRPPTPRPPFVPRSLTLRLALESAGEHSFIEDVATVLRSRGTVVGTNVFVSGPAPRNGPPAAVIEYDGEERGSGVTVRGADANDAATLVCTNHMRLRAEPTACRRYARLQERFAELSAERKLDVGACFALLAEIAQDQALQTVHSVVFEPGARRMHVRLRGGPSDPTLLDLGELLEPASGRP